MSECVVFEKDVFALCKVELIRAVAHSGFSVIGGSHIASVVEQLGMESRLDHVSTGGGRVLIFWRVRNYRAPRH